MLIRPLTAILSIRNHIFTLFSQCIFLFMQKLVGVLLMVRGILLVNLSTNSLRFGDGGQFYCLKSPFYSFLQIYLLIQTKVDRDIARGEERLV